MVLMNFCFSFKCISTVILNVQDCNFVIIINPAFDSLSVFPFINARRGMYRTDLLLGQGHIYLD